MPPSPTSKNERRKSPRFPAKSTAIAILNANPVRIGQILDVSANGLAFSYMENVQWPPFCEKALLELNCEGVYLMLQPHQYHIVADIPLASDVPFSTIPMRRISFALNDLSTEEKNTLHLYRRF